MEQVERKQKKKEVYIYQNNVVVDIHKEKENVKLVDNHAVVMDKVVGMVVIVYGTDKTVHEEAKAKMKEVVESMVDVLIEAEGLGNIRTKVKR